MKKILITFLLSLVLFAGVKTQAYGFGFKKNSAHIAPDIGIYKDVITGTNSYYVGNNEDKILYLTMDAGYDNGNMTKILDVLKEEDVKVTFFLTGDFFKYKELLIRMINEGHLIGNHTMHHKNITKLTSDEIEKEIQTFEEKVNEFIQENNLAVTNVKFFRPPEGEFDKRSLQVVQALGYKTFFWSIAYNDWNTSKQHGKEYGYQMIMDNLHNGAIILMHSVSNDNVLCLKQVITDARNQGYIFKNLNEFK